MSKSEKPLKEVFKVKVGDKELELAVKRPDASLFREAQQEYNRTFCNLLNQGAILAKSLEAHLRRQGIWSDDHEKRRQELREKILQGQKKIMQGDFKLSEAKKVALDVRMAQMALVQLEAETLDMASNTAEGQAENARFNYLLAKSVVYNDTGKPYYKDLDDYLNRVNDDVAGEAAKCFAKLTYGADTKVPDSIEVKFLKKYKFVDDKLRLINKDGHLIDADGRLINEDGYYVDENDNLVDKDGNPVTAEGEFKIETKPFLDDDGNPVPEPDPQL